jgi:hypothetical protein
MQASATRPLGKVSGKGEVRGPNGELKGYIEFEGTTDLTEEDLRRRLQGDPAEQKQEEVK